MHIPFLQFAQHLSTRMKTLRLFISQKENVVGNQAIQNY